MRLTARRGYAADTGNSYLTSVPITEWSTARMTPLDWTGQIRGNREALRGLRSKLYSRFIAVFRGSCPICGAISVEMRHDLTRGGCS